METLDWEKYYTGRQSLVSHEMIERETPAADITRGIFPNLRGICDETWTCGTNSDFSEKSRPNYPAAIVQNWSVSC
jgi:hypothetical protein